MLATAFSAWAFTVAAMASAGPAHGALDVSHFSVTASDTRAGAHPNLRVAVKLSDPASGLKDLALHLPAGLTAIRSAIPYCSQKRLLADLCPRKSKAGSITVVGQAFGFTLALTRRIYNVRPTGAEALRLAVPIFGTVSRPGLAAELPVTLRPDRGLDMAVTGLPREVNGIAIQVKELSFTIRGLAISPRKKGGKKRPFLTNPRSCEPATSRLDVTSHSAPGVVIPRSSTYVPTGCGI